jgi:hypothetical protein
MIGWKAIRKVVNNKLDLGKIIQRLTRFSTYMLWCKSVLVKKVKCFSKKGQKLYVAFVDFRKAFDSVKHETLLDVIQREGIKGKFFVAIKSMYNSLISCVRSNGKYSIFLNAQLAYAKDAL